MLGFKIEICPDFSIKLGLLPKEYRPKQTDWKNLEQDMNSPVITPIPDWKLKNRWLDKCAAIAVYNNKIVSYSSIIPSYNEHKRQLLCSYLDIKNNQIPTIDIYESASGWTDPKWRLQGINKKLRNKLYEKIDGINKMGMSACYGQGASPVLFKCHWTLISWNEYRFIRSLLGWIESEKYFWLNSKKINSIDREPYCGIHLKDQKYEQHDWNRYYHIWTQNLETTQQVNTQFSKLMNGDIRAWRNALKRLP